MQGTYGAVQFSGMTAAMQNANRRTSPSRMEEIQGKAFVAGALRPVDLIEFPDLVIGFKVKDKALAQDQLDRIELNLQTVLGNEPAFQQPFPARERSPGIRISRSRSTATWSPGTRSWLEKIRSLAATPADGDRLIDHLQKVKLVISLGMRDDFLLLAIGRSTDVLASWAGGCAAPRGGRNWPAVGTFADKRIVSVGYSSKKMNQHFSQTRRASDNLLQMAKNLLPGLPVPEKLRDDLAKDAAEMAFGPEVDDPEVGASSSVGFLTKQRRGKLLLRLEPHRKWTAPSRSTCSITSAATRFWPSWGEAKVSSEGYDLLVKWAGIAHRYLDDYGVPQMKAKSASSSRNSPPRSIRCWDGSTRPRGTC